MRLTMGGEPTFVSIDDMDGDEWNTAADGPEEAAPGRRYCSSGCARFATGGLFALRPGQWYPGEQLAALGAGLLLAQGRRADLARSGA